LGFLLDQTGDKEGAVEAYKKALEIKPDYFEANFNTGVYYYNEAIAKQNEINNLGISKEDQAKRKEMQPLVPEYFKKARPYFEAAIATNPDDLSILETLQLIYMQIGEDAKAKETTSRIEALGGGN
jgi:tetratricopeptide (TPR) repeat protein